MNITDLPAACVAGSIIEREVMPISLTVNDLPGAAEVRRGLAQLIEKVNVENQKNADVKLREQHYRMISDLVTKFNRGSMQAKPLKESLLTIFKDTIYVARTAQSYEDRRREMEEKIKNLQQQH